MLDFPQNVGVFVFSSMILAVVLELWAIGKYLKSINDTLERYEKHLTRFDRTDTKDS